MTDPVKKKEIWKRACERKFLLWFRNLYILEMMFRQRAWFPKGSRLHLSGVLMAKFCLHRLSESNM